MEYYIAMKKDKVLLPTMWRDLTGMSMSERSQDSLWDSSEMNQLCSYKEEDIFLR